MTLRQRLSIAVVGAIGIALALFASISIVAIDRTLRRTLDERLATTARAIETSLDVHHGRISIDGDDRAQIATLRARARASVLDATGRPLLGDPPPPANAGLYVVSVPVVHQGVVVGRVAAWRSDASIGDFDRIAVLVSLAIAAALLLAGLGAARWAADAALEPLVEFAALAERIEGRDLSLRLRATGDDELGRLGQSFDRMLDRLQDAF